ncbi:hypothetical protein PGTUg99_009404 [Puccinia graminis f. sp. tritici]|uniref:Uncharacterized protein n=1 Tax=Puccinia graminis f. sp. tritici TaxID=56615 RepID=A0A5B0N134_PUCGR|nr:hypothetical protein PGTUg99_009404 [Puccinia graminis f. sp. tritici]
MGDAFKAPRRFRLEGDLESARQTLSTRIKVASKLTWERSTGGSRFGGDLKNHPRRLVTGFKAVCKPTWKRSRHDGRLQVVFEMKLQPHLSCTLGGISLTVTSSADEPRGIIPDQFSIFPTNDTGHNFYIADGAIPAFSP